MPPQSTPTLGLVGASGVSAANLALRRIVEDRLRDALINDKRVQQETENQFEQRRLDEAERRNRKLESQGDTGLIYEGRRVGQGDRSLSQGDVRLTYEGNADKRAADEAAHKNTLFDLSLADRQELQNLTRQVPGNRGLSLNLKRLGVNPSQEDIYSPEEMGQMSAAQAKGAWLGGGKDLFTEKERIQSSFQPEKQQFVQGMHPIFGPGVVNKKTNTFTPLTVLDPNTHQPMAGANDEVGIGRPLPPEQIDKITGYDNGVEQLGELKKVLTANKQYLGPISGVASLTPWSKAKQARADVDRVRQTVGKTLEGGVLRKEDEEKYKYILSTMFDTPETAIYKIEELEKSITEQGNMLRKNLSDSGFRSPVLKQHDIPGRQEAEKKTITMAQLANVVAVLATQGEKTDVAAQKARYEALGYVVK